MRISLVIAAHNEEARIADCIASIQRALEMHPSNAEIVVVANACTDKTAEIARGMRGVRVVEEPKKGLSQARSTGFTASDGDIVANLDADIHMSSAWIPFVLNVFATTPNLVALSGPYIYHDLPGLTQWFVKLFYAAAYINSRISMTLLGTGAMLQGGNFVVRRSAMEKIGGYNTSITFYGEDTDIARRLMKVGEVRWTFKLPMRTSGRRFAEEGLLRTGFYYTINYLSTSFSGSPVTKTHEDVRTEKN